MRYGQRRIVLLALLCAGSVFFPVPLLGGEDPDVEIERRFLPLKPYLEVDSSQIRSLGRDGRNVDAKFEGEFVRRTSVPSIAREVTVRDRTYRIARAVRLQGDITALIPAGHHDSIAKARGLQEGEVVTVYGTTMRRRGGDNFFLIDRFATAGERIRAGYELRLQGSDGRTRVIGAPGQYSLEFPCRHEPDETEVVDIIVRELSPQELSGELEELEESDEGQEVEAEDGAPPAPGEDLYDPPYSRYDAGTIYRAIADGRRLDAQFTDAVRRRLRAFPARIRDHEGRVVRIGGAFETRSGPLVCLVPARSEEYIEQLDYLLADLSVRLWGTTLRTIAGDRLFLVHRMEVPGLILPPEPDHHWLVTVRSGRDRPRVFFREGRYELRLPCQHAPERQETVRARLSAQKVIEMELP